MLWPLFVLTIITVETKMKDTELFQFSSVQFSRSVVYAHTASVLSWDPVHTQSISVELGPCVHTQH